MGSSIRNNGLESEVSAYETPISISIESSSPFPTFEIHPVCLPPKTTTFQKFKRRFAEIFFPDDPLHKYKNQTVWTKLFLFFKSFFPIIGWLPGYSFSLFRSDVISGLTIASLAIPQEQKLSLILERRKYYCVCVAFHQLEIFLRLQWLFCLGISYAKLAELPPIYGLYSSFVPPLIYSVLGTSRHLGVGPVSIASLVMGTMLSEIISPTKEPDLYLKLAISTTLFAGIFQASLGLFRLGFIIDYLSKATLVGFMAGAAIIVSLQQLKGLLGIAHFTSKMQVIPVLTSVFDHTEEWNWQTIVMGISFLTFLLTARLIGLRKPKLFWISAAAPLTSVIISTILVFLLKSKLHDISKIGELPEGLNPSSINKLYLHGPHLGLGIKTGIVTGILSLTEGIAVGRTFASQHNYRVDGNKEMRAIGIMNIVGSFSSCYVTTGSFSRSAVNHNAGAKTAVSNIVMAIAVLVTLLFLMPLFYYTPNVVLAAIIITAVIGLIDYDAAIHLWKIDKLDFIACLCSFFGVLFCSVQIGLAIAIGVSILKILLHVTRPNTYALGNIPGTQLYLNLNRYETASRVPSILILSIESPIYFANSTYLQERILRWVREEEERIEENKEMNLKSIILDMTAVTAIDTSGVDAIDELHNTLHQRSLTLNLVNPVGDVTEKLHNSKVLDVFKSDKLFLSVGEAIAAILSSGSHS